MLQTRNLKPTKAGSEQRMIDRVVHYRVDFHYATDFNTETTHSYSSGDRRAAAAYR